MKNLLIVLQAILAAALIASILVQQRGAGLGTIFGGGGESYRSKRGMERIIFMATIGLATGFIIISILNLFI